MEREILFRGKRTDNGEWVYGDLIHYDDEPSIHTKASYGLYKHERVDPSTVGQFTGLYDAAGTRIFEGDIVAGYEPDEGSTESVGFPISYLDAGFGVKYQTAPPLYHVLERRDCEYYAVIGNVHDNPELAINAVS